MKRLLTLIVIFIIVVQAFSVGVYLSRYKRVSVAVLFDEGGRFLILKNSRGPFKGFWGVPGGKADPFESNRKAVKREAFEETGIILEEGAYRFRHSYYVDHGPSQRFKISVFEHRFEARPEVILDLREHSEARWISLEEMWQFEFMPKGDEVIRKLYCKSQGQMNEKV